MPDEALANRPTIDQARLIARAGLRVLPIKPGRKNPPMKSWQHAASVEDRTINAWWNGLYRDHGIGIAMGPQPDGRVLFAIDIDTHDEDANGYDTIETLEVEYGPLPDTVTSNTGSGGQHQIFAAPNGTVIRNQQNAGQRIGPGVDVRGDGGQIVVAPTIHPDTRRPYEWSAGRAPWEHPVAEAPGWLLDLVVEQDRPAPPTPQQQRGIDYSAEASTSAADMLRERWNWRAELERVGWTHDRDDGIDSYWVRPGKDRRQGHSAVLHGTDGPLVVFTTEIPVDLARLGKLTPAGDGRSFSPLQWEAGYRHGGDLSAASRAVWGSERHQPSNLSTTAANEATADVEPDYDDVLRAMLLDWGEFWSTDHKDAEWIAEPLIPARRSTALFAPGGTGKSLLALYISACVATGTALLGRRSEPRSVLYLDYEMTADDLAERLEQMGFGEEADLENLHYALLPSLPPLDDPEGGKAVVRLAEMVGAELVVIDTFGRAIHGDENDADTVRSFYRWTGLHLKHAGRAFLRVDHAGKDVTKGQRGSSAKNDDVDVVWQMTAKEDGVFTLTAKKRRMGWVPMTVDVVMNDEDRLTFNLLHGVTYPAGTAAVAEELSAMGVPADASSREAIKAFRGGGGSARDNVIRAAQKYRTESGNPTTEGAKSAAQKSGRAPQGNDRAAAPAAVDPNSALPLVDDSGRGSGRGGPRPPDASGPRCVPPRGTRASSVTEEISAEEPPTSEDLFG